MRETQKQLSSNAIPQTTKGADPSKVVQIRNIETNLMQLNIATDKYKADLDKIPENAKTIAQRRRREFLEQEMKVIGKNLGLLKGKLRDLGEL